MIRMSLLIGLVVSLSVSAAPATIIVQNVVIPDRDHPDQDRTVNLIIKDGLLDLVTEEGLPEQPGIPSYNADGGVLLGTLRLRESAAFLILDRDPRTDINSLLDTKTFGTFAMANGEVVRNRLDRIREDNQSKQGWFAYTPPPNILPSKYDSRQKWNFYNSDTFTNLFTLGIVLDQTRWESQDRANEMQVGDLTDFDGGEVRAFRFGVIGAIKRWDRPLTYTVLGATTAFDKGFDTDEDDDFLFTDVRLDIPVWGDNTLSLGKQKEPISLERITGLVYLPFQERTAAVDTFLPSRNVGMVLSGGAFTDRMSWAGGVFNDWLDSGGSRSDSSTQWIGRVTGIPLVTEDESNLLHIGFGYRHSNFDEGGRGASDPEANSAPNFIDSGFIPASDKSEIYNYELSWRKGPYWIHGEYTDVDITDSPGIGDLGFHGYHISASWTLTGEMRPYNHKTGIFSPIPIARPVNQNGWGAWEVGLRYSFTDLSDESIQGGEMEVWTLGLNWWLQRNIQATFGFRHVELKRIANGGTLPITGHANGWTSRISIALD
jgi:phosphate-selective porin OprO/OprP